MEEDSAEDDLLIDHNSNILSKTMQNFRETYVKINNNEPACIAEEDNGLS